MEAKVFKVALHAVNKQESAMLDRAFRLSQHRPRAYEQSNLQQADLVITGSEYDTPPTNSPILIIVEKDNSTLPTTTPTIQRPLLPNRVLKSLDQITLEVLNYAPELNVGSSVEAATGIYSALKDTSKRHGRQGGNSSGNLKVLVVDDSSLVQKQMEIILSGISISADYAADGATAITKHSTNNYDLIFMDVMMPGMDGFQACKAIKKLNVAPPKIIMLTSKGSPINRAHGMIVGADAYLTKPANQESLSNAIKKVTKQ